MLVLSSFTAHPLSVRQGSPWSRTVTITGRGCICNSAHNRQKEERGGVFDVFVCGISRIKGKLPAAERSFLTGSSLCERRHDDSAPGSPSPPANKLDLSLAKDRYHLVDPKYNVLTRRCRLLCSSEAWVLHTSIFFMGDLSPSPTTRR